MQNLIIYWKNSQKTTKIINKILKLISIFIKNIVDNFVWIDILNEEWYYFKKINLNTIIACI